MRTRIVVAVILLSTSVLVLAARPSMFHHVSSSSGVHRATEPSKEELDALPRNRVLFGCVGDVNGDGNVDAADYTIVKSLLDTRHGNPGYIVAADLNHDGIIDSGDLRVVQIHLGCNS